MLLQIMEFYHTRVTMPLQHDSFQMGHLQVIHISKYTKKNCCNTSLILNETSSLQLTKLY